MSENLLNRSLHLGDAAEFYQDCVDAGENVDVIHDICGRFVVVRKECSFYYLARKIWGAILSCTLHHDYLSFDHTGNSSRIPCQQITAAQIVRTLTEESDTVPPALRTPKGLIKAYALNKLHDYYVFEDKNEDDNYMHDKYTRMLNPSLCH